MKVLFFSFPGFADCGLPMVKALQDKGVDITYILEVTPTCLNCNLFSISKQLPIDGIIPATEYPELKVYDQYADMSKVLILNRTTKPASDWNALKNALRLVRFIKKEGFDVIHTDYQPYMWLTMLYFFKSKLLFTVHDPFPHSGEGSKIKTFFRNIAFKFSKYFLLLNKNQGEDFMSYYKISADRVFYNKLGVYECMTIGDDVYTKKESSKNILFFGRISPYKGIEYLCEAMKIVHEEIPEATLTIAGGGKMYFDHSEYLKLPYIEFKNRFIKTEELAEMLRECSISVCPYTDATQSGVIMSSFAFCKPVIATNVGGLGEMITDGETGVLVPPRDSVSLADAMIKLLNDDRTIESMSQEIYKTYYKGMSSWQQIASQYEIIYKSISNK